MCYNINYLTKKKAEYARRLGGLLSEDAFEKTWDALSGRSQPVFYENGFNHPDIPVITNEIPDRIQLYSWGLIPFWVKDSRQAVDLSKKTLNARGENIFQKPSFRNAARKKRCLVLVDGFFEYHWHHDKAFPYFIQMKNRDPILLAGLWESWHYREEDLHRYTCSIITTRANSLMSYIHNRPKGSEGSRMPVIIPEGLEKKWLKDIRDLIDQEEIKDLIQPFDDSLLDSFTVPPLRGKAGVGNSPNAITHHSYAELSH